MTVGISVVIPAFNAGQRLRRCVESARASAVSEIVVVDDGSTDDTAQVARRLGCIVETQANAGAAAARRLGISLTRHTHVVLLDADDELLPPGLRASRMAAESNPNAIILGRVATRSPDGALRERAWRLNELSARGLLVLGHSPCPPGAITWPRRVLVDAVNSDNAGVWPRFAEDYELLIRGALRAELALAPHEAVTLIYNTQGGKSARNAVAAVHDAQAIRQFYAQQVGLKIPSMSAAQCAALAHLRLFRVELDAGMRPSAAAQLARAFAASPRLVTGTVVDIARRRARRQFTRLADRTPAFRL